MGNDCDRAGQAPRTVPGALEGAGEVLINVMITPPDKNEPNKATPEMKRKGKEPGHL